jgi:hypothetical protein
VLRFSALSAAFLATISIALLKDSARADALDNWTPVQISTNPVGYMGMQPTSFAYGNGRYVLAGDYAASDFGFIETSEDGFNWTMRTSYSSAVLDIYDVTFGNGVFVAVGWSDGFGDPIIYNSTNGINWTPVFSEAGNIYRVISGGGRFVAVGDPFDTNNNNICLSLNGNTWSPRSSGFSDTIYDVAYGAGRFVAVDAAGHIYNSPTGSTWTRTTNSNAGRYVSFCFDRFFVSAGTGTNLVSFDGLAWSLVSNNSGATFNRVIYAGGYYVAISYADVFSSTDGVNWIRRNLPPTQGVFRNLTAINFLTGSVFIAGYTDTGDSRPRLPVLYISDPLASLKINAGNPPNLTLSGLTNRSYRIEYLTDLRSNNWQTLSNFTLSNSPFTWLDSTATNSSRYYRAVLLP